MTTIGTAPNTTADTDEAALCPLRVGHLLKSGESAFPTAFSQAYNKKAVDEQKAFDALTTTKANPDTDICTNCRIRWIPGWSVSVKIEFLTTKRKKAVRNLVYRCDKCSYKLKHALPAPGTARIKRVPTKKVKEESKVTKPGSKSTPFASKPQSKFGKAGKASSSANSLKAMLELKKQKEKENSSLNLMDFMN
ncbi:hypothetical protein CJU90_2581 [Yarrowia sp. C11]|nr:hypothetical protein CKK34_4029 [Yarrowia sp. E02]KAG5369135.1 hypothetical protein CJU90_2581 [Yarrowia sp. C11]